MANVPQNRLAGRGPTRNRDSEFHTAYLYYFSADLATVAAYELFSGYEKPLPDNPVAVATGLVANAYSNGANPPKYANNVADLMRRRKGYIIFAVHNKVLKKNKPIKFKRSRYRYIGDGDSKPGGMNDGAHTFEQIGTSFTLTLSDVEQIGIVIYSCGMQKKIDSSTADLDKGEWESFLIDFTFDNKQKRVDLDGGTNLGPPPPPPGRKYKKSAASLSARKAQTSRK